jgi:hypothetical protein
MRKLIINKKYTHFCVSKSTGKIVDAWEYKALDKESIAEYYKIDMKDNDRPIKEFSLLTKKFLLSKSINPFDVANWGNN